MRRLHVIDGRFYLEIDPEILQQLAIDAETPLVVSVENGALVVRPEGEDLLAIADAVMDLHDDTFRRLAL